MLVTKLPLDATIFQDKICTTSNEASSFIYGNNSISYSVIRKLQPADTDKKSPRKVLIKVLPDQGVIVTVPNDASEDEIQGAMFKRAKWIWKNINEFSKQKLTVLPRRYVSGETQFYLGKRYVLKVIVDAEQAPSVKLSRGKLLVTLSHKLNNSVGEKESSNQFEIVKPLIDKWYQHRAKAVFNERLSELLPRAIWVKGIPSFRVLAMKKQWGSCSTKGNLMLNPHLVKAPKECIDYVILHELCHIAVHNHSEQFWRLLTQVIPNWKEVKANLDGMAETYLNE